MVDFGDNSHEALVALCAAMVAIAGYFKYLEKDFCPLDIVPFARVEV